MRDSESVVDRRSEESRMRRGEPAPTAERAAVEEALARRIMLRRWWQPWALLVIGLLQVPTVVAGHGVVVRLFALAALLAFIAWVAWYELNRRGAARLLDANRQRWGDL